MGMSTHVIGFRPPDDEWRRMKAAWDACDRAGVPAPAKVLEFFNHEPPDECGVEVKLGTEALREYGTERPQRAIWDVHLDKLPPGLKIIRFFNSW